MSPGIENEAPELARSRSTWSGRTGSSGSAAGTIDDRYQFGESILGPAVKMNNDVDGDAFLGARMTILLRGEGGKRQAERQGRARIPRTASRSS